MFVHNIDPTLFRIGILEIRYYGIIYALGFIIAYFMIDYLVKRKEVDLTKEDVADLVFYLIIGTIAGARLFFVFYNLGYFIKNPLEIITIWRGGLIFLGGFIGAIIAVKLFCKKKNISFYKIADLCIIPLALSLALGRIANFINAELVGRITTVPWAVKFPGHDGFRHPVQLYNSLANFFNFSVLWYLKNKKLKDGILFWSFLSIYSISRFLLGFFKAADQYGFILGMTIEQVVFIATFIISIIFLVKINGKNK